MSVWTCSKCTFDNPQSASACEMCGASRPTVAEASRYATRQLLQASQPQRGGAGAAQKSAAAPPAAAAAPDGYVIEAVENFLRGREWRETVTTFVNAHCAMFADIEGEQGHGQYEVFQNFQATVDGLLGGVLQELGSREEAFIEACQRHLDSPDRGRRDTAVKELLRTLFTYENFLIFRKMMHDRNADLETKEKFESDFNAQSLRYQQEQAQLRTSSAQRIWNCVSCSYANEHPSEQCAMCGTMRTVAAIRRQSLRQLNPSEVSTHGPRAAGDTIRNSLGVGATAGRHIPAASVRRAPRGYERKVSSEFLDVHGTEGAGGGGGGGGGMASAGQTLRQRPLVVPRSSTTLQRRRPARMKKVPFAALCLKAYVATKATEMSINVGDEVVITDVTSSEHWWYGEVATTGKEGWIPCNALASDAQAYDDDAPSTAAATAGGGGGASASTRPAASNKRLIRLLSKGDGSRNNSGGGGGDSSSGLQDGPRPDRRRSAAKPGDIAKKKSFVQRMSSDSVSDEEFRHLMPVNVDREIRHVFEEYDTTRSGSLTSQELGRLFSDMKLPCNARELKQCMAMLDTNANGEVELVEFYRLWSISRDDSGSDAALVTNRLCDLRKRVGEKHSIFFGFNFDDWQSANDLVQSDVVGWSTRDVAKWFAFHGDLGPVRKYLSREALAEVDGETLLELTPGYLVDTIGVKQIHVNKCMRVINGLRTRNGLEEVHVVPPTPSRSRAGSKVGEGAAGEIEWDAQATEMPTAARPVRRRTRRSSSQDDEGGGNGGTPRRARSRPQRQVGAWRRGQLIGQGAYGKVYQGLELETGSLVAVKQIVVTMDQREREELQGEISVMSRLKHENIVRYLGAQWDEPNQQLFIFTEWVPGGSLSDILKKFGKLTEGIVARYTRQCLLGLVYLHSHDVIHLDIKPGNVLVDNLGNIKLADFGASRKLVDGRSVRAGPSGEGKNGDVDGGGSVELLGTPYFMAPEMIKQTRHGRGADLWSLAGTVLNMLTGVPPWSQLGIKSTMALLFHISNATAPPEYPAELRELDEVIGGGAEEVSPSSCVNVAVVIFAVSCSCHSPFSHRRTTSPRYAVTSATFSTRVLSGRSRTARAPPSCWNTRSSCLLPATSCDKDRNSHRRATGAPTTTTLGPGRTTPRTPSWARWASGTWRAPTTTRTAPRRWPTKPPGWRPHWRPSRPAPGAFLCASRRGRTSSCRTTSIPSSRSAPRRRT